MAEPRNRRPAWQAAALRAVEGVAAVYCAVFVVLLGATALQMRARPPLDTPALVSLRTEVQAQPENAALREQVRALDALVRRAHFSGVHSLRVGAGLFLAGLAVLLLAWHGARAAESTGLPPRPDRPGSSRDPAASSRRALMIAAGVCLVLAVTLSVWRPGPAPPPAPPDAERTDSATQPADPDLPAPQPFAPRPDGMAPRKSCPWPMFRGPDGLGVAREAAPPLAWDGAAGSNVLWRTPVPRAGFSSPIVCGDVVYLTGGDAGLREVYAFDAKDGALLWRHPATGIAGAPAEPPEVTDDTGYAAPTMCSDGRRVFALFATGNLLALDLEGKRAWGRNLGVPDNPYGHASSLLVFEDRLLVQYDDAAGGEFIALDTATGETAWIVERDVVACWASPILVRAERGPQVILNGNPTVAGYDPRNGDLLWSDDCMGGEVAVSPAYDSGRCYVGNAYARLVAFDIENDAARRWEAEVDLPDVSSPVAWSNRLWLGTDYGTVTCRDGRSGDVLWTHEYDDGFYASPVVAGGRVHMLDMQGVMHVLEAGPAFRELAANPLGERSTCTAAFVGHRIYVRGEKHLYCLGVE